MCRSKDEGGRRCPSNRGERKRAYQRARYAAQKTEALRKKGFNPHTPRPLTDLSALTNDQLNQIRDAALADAAERRAAVNNIADACGFDNDRPSHEYSRFVADFTAEEQHEYRAAGGDVTIRGVTITPDERADTLAMTMERKYVAATQHTGDAIARAADAIYEQKLRELNWDDPEHRERLLYNAYPAVFKHRRIVRALDGADDHFRDRTEPVAVAEITDLLDAELAGEHYRPALEYAAFDVMRHDGERLGEWRRRWDETTHLDPDEAREIIKEMRTEATIRTASDAHTAQWYADDPHHRVPALRNARTDAVREALEAVQTFGVEKWDNLTFTGSQINDTRDTVNNALSHYPDSMVSYIKQTYPDLHIKRIKGRAFFSERHTRTKRVTGYDWAILPENFILDGTDPTDPWYVTSHQSWGAERPGLASLFDADDYDKVADWCKRHNAGHTKLTVPREGSQTYPPERATVKPVKFTDENGTERVGIRTTRGRPATERSIGPLITTNGSLSTTIHEFGHAAERHPRIHVACKRFLADRTAGCEETVYKKSKKHGVEMVRADGFYSSYAGKDYGGVATEIFTMGMEGCMTNAKLLDTPGKGADAEHRNLILGLLTTFR